MEGAAARHAGGGTVPPGGAAARRNGGGMPGEEGDPSSVANGKTVATCRGQRPGRLHSNGLAENSGPDGESVR